MTSIVDLRDRTTISLEGARSASSLDFVWRATLRSGVVILEQPGLSSDALPRDEIAQIEYVPARREDLPVITCRINLDAGERFVRYWPNIWRDGRGGFQKLYCAGIENRQGRFALLAFYPLFGKFILASTKPFQPPWIPQINSCLPAGCILRGGPRTNHIGWCHEGFGGTVLAKQKHLIFAAAYE